MFGNAIDNQLHGHIDMGDGKLGAESPIQDVKIVGASETSLRNFFLIGVASSLVAGLIIWYAFERKNTAPYKRGGGYVSRSVAR